MFPTNDELFNLMILKGATGGAVVEATATGNPLTFITDKAKPLKSLLIPFAPKQEGTGDPSPQNIRPLLPWNGLTVWNGNSNLLKNENLKPNLYNLADNGTVTAVDPSSQQYAWSYANSIFKTYLPAGKYTVIEETVIAPTQTGTGFNIKDENNGWLAERGYATFTLTQGKNVGLVCKPGDGAFRYSIVKGTAGEYEKQETTETDISFPAPVYGGTPDIISGRMLVEWYGVSAKWGQGINKSFIGEYERRWFDMPSGLIAQSSQYYNNHKSEVGCNIAKYVWDWNRAETHFYCSMENSTNHFYVFLPQGTSDETDIQCMCKLKEPFEIQLTPQQITALIGNNTIWSDADGSMTAVYLKKK